MATRWQRLVALGVTVTVLGGTMAATTPSVDAQPNQPKAKTSPEDLAKAKRLFRAGARAYDRGQFAAAAQAFEQAYELSPRIALRFSAGQARMRQYTVDRDAENLTRAREHFQAYVDEVKQGRRVKDAVEALGEIELLLAKVEPKAPEPTPPPAGEGGQDGDGGAGGGVPTPSPAPEPPPPKATKVTGTLQIDSDVEGATATVVGRPGVIDELPAWLDVPPGDYEVIVRADGYEDARRTVRIQPRRLGLAFPTLKPIPATLAVTGPRGAEVLLDGRLAGRIPLSISVDGGVHTIVAGQKGHENVSRTVVLQRGQSEQLNVDLPLSGQRIAAHTFIGISGAAFAAAVASITYSRVVLGQADQVLSVTEGDDRRPLNERELEDYRDKQSFANLMGIIGGGSLGVGVVSLGVGLLLFGFDGSNLEDATVIGPPSLPDDDADPDPATVDLKADIVPELINGQMTGVTFMLQGTF